MDEGKRSRSSATAIAERDAVLAAVEQLFFRNADCQAIVNDNRAKAIEKNRNTKAVQDSRNAVSKNLHQDKTVYSLNFKIRCNRGAGHKTSDYLGIFPFSLHFDRKSKWKTMKREALNVLKTRLPNPHDFDEELWQFAHDIRVARKTEWTEFCPGDDTTMEDIIQRERTHAQAQNNGRKKNIEIIRNKGIYIVFIQRDDDEIINTLTATRRAISPTRTRIHSSDIEPSDNDDEPLLQEAVIIYPIRIEDSIHCDFEYNTCEVTLTDDHRGSGAMRHCYKAFAKDNNQILQTSGTGFVGKVFKKEYLAESGVDISDMPTILDMYLQTVRDMWAANCILKDYQDWFKGDPSFKDKKVPSLTYIPSYVVILNPIMQSDGSLPLPEDYRDIFTLEPELPKKSFRKYISNTRFKNLPKNNITKYLSSFLHWSAIRLKYERLVTDLQGSGKFLTDPFMAKIKTGLGADVIKTFIQQHECNEICKFFPELSMEEFQIAKRKAQTKRQKRSFEKQVNVEENVMVEDSDIDDENELEVEDCEEPAIDVEGEDEETIPDGSGSVSDLELQHLHDKRLMVKLKMPAPTNDN